MKNNASTEEINLEHISDHRRQARQTSDVYCVEVYMHVNRNAHNNYLGWSRANEREQRFKERLKEEGNDYKKIHTLNKNATLKWNEQTITQTRKERSKNEGDF